MHSVTYEEISQINDKELGEVCSGKIDIIAFLQKLDKTKNKKEYILSGHNFPEIAECIEQTDCGYKYHISLFWFDKMTQQIKTDKFEAILANPFTYLKQLLPAGIQGFFVRKTNFSTDYMKSIDTGMLIK